ncbi:EAL domain-containing protein [Thalassotalea ponticola]|uniref:putative bifunctional diguanylate cyclase/phosphodiesterase n=1 Tax=Thalassotalea ponticola TaxID=1523392 RepID=UPI0025B52928|nr:EAL domain-containing protein [Thalassotalea ponticola]MDN3651203.1 EAL domain-containing protein [Thalassotalea ponticola]
MALQFDSLRKNIVFLVVVLLLTVQGVSLYTTYLANKRLEEQQLKLQLLRAETLLQNELENRSYYTLAFAETVAKDSDLKNAFSADERRILLSLDNHRQRIEADIAMALDGNARVIGQLLTTDAQGEQAKTVLGQQIGEQFEHRNWLSQQSQTHFWLYQDNLYQLVLSPVNDQGKLIGYVSFGYKIDQRLVDELEKLISFHVGIGMVEHGQWRWIAKSERGNRRLEGFAPIAHVDDYDLVYSSYPLGNVNESSLIVTTYRTRASLIGAVSKDSAGLILMILVMCALSLVAAYYIAIIVTQPLTRLLRFSKAIAKGEYESHVDVGKSKELNLLAKQLDTMQNAIHQREREISRQAYYDHLTQIPNRNQFYRDMKSEQGALVVSQISICRLSQINDTLGHKVGDEVICEVAHRLKQLHVPLYKTSGNGFIVVFPNCQSSQIEPCINKLIRKVEASFVVQNIALHIQAHAGVTVAKGQVNAGQILKEVDSAMQLAKRMNVPYQIYDDQIDLNTLDRLQLLSRVKPALESDEFVLHFQPKLNLADNRIDEVEALVRWQHPVHGLLKPDRFMHNIEQTGQMKALSIWVVKHAIAQYLGWRKQGLDIKISVNISPCNLVDRDFCDELIDIVINQNNLASALILEITENAFIDENSNAMENIQLLKEQGICLSIDDYGTGYSSLAKLKSLTVEELKIDRCFIHNVVSDSTDQMIVRSTLELAHKLGLVVVAEGVEDEETLKWLLEHHCEKAQGYFISRPMPAQEFARWLRRSKGYFTQNSKQPRKKLSAKQHITANNSRTRQPQDFTLPAATVRNASVG